MRKIRRHLSFANVVACLALFVALGGVGYAATQLPKNSVGSPQIRKNAVKTGDIAPNAVKTGKLGPEAAKAGKIAKNAITTNRLRNNAVTGAKVKEATLGTVPNAANATNASHAESADAAPLPQTLSSGRSEKGVWGLADEASAGSDVYLAPISFPVPLASSPTAHYIPANTPPPAGCSGNVAAPAADPGNLCVFQRLILNLSHFSFYDPETETESATASSKTGALIVFESDEAGEVQTLGTFAVTAG